MNKAIHSQCRKLLTLLFAVIAICSSNSFAPIRNAVAGNISGSVNIHASVQANCRIMNSTNLAFGTYDSTGPNSNVPLDASSTFQISCTKNTTAVIRINSGLNGSHATGTSTRALYNSGTGDYLNYDIFTNSSRTTVWNQSTGVVSYNAVSASPATLTIYGRIPAKQNQAKGGSYVDIVTINATF